MANRTTFPLSPLVLGGSPGRWKWDDNPDSGLTMNGIEAWVYALQGSYKQGRTLEERDLHDHDLVVLNLNFGYLPYYDRVLQKIGRPGAKLVGLFEGDLDQLNLQWKQWSSVADRCDLIIGINGYGIEFMAGLTSAPVRFIGIPYPVDGVHQYTVPIEEREQEIFLCAPLLKRPHDYLAARQLGLPVYTYELTFSRRLRNVMQHRSLDKQLYVHRARQLYADPNLSILPRTHLPGFFQRTAQSFLWMDLDPRYTWARYVLDAASLGVPIITTRNTWHGPQLFPDLIVESPYDITGANRIATQLLEEPEFYRRVVAQATAGLDWYKPEQTVQRLIDALQSVEASTPL